MAKKPEEKNVDDRCSEPALLILISLADGPKHGYAMTQDIEAVSGHRLGPGTLYGAIQWLEGKGWIKPLAAEDRRRPYQLTEAGRSALQARMAHFRVMLRVGQARLSEG